MLKLLVEIHAKSFHRIIYSILASNFPVSLSCLIYTFISDTDFSRWKGKCNKWNQTVIDWCVGM